MSRQQLIISGVGGQGILFITRLLAETAIAKGLPVLTSETHGMAQRGGIVISHLKVGDFSSPLVRPGKADLLLSLKAETVALHLHFLNHSGTVAANARALPEAAAGKEAVTVDADTLALNLGDPRSVNLIVLGRALAQPGMLFCSAEEVIAVLKARLAGKEKQLQGALAALKAGMEYGAA
ncbi:indolepyruvate oxidoreductase subunit beta [Geomesophilobacter sediminis]|uniref:Indolepyruvate oxidoreductase subunit beta n=1 Tax=Geomesophilobacter sediminis TaxID=2798584 RepID=A0A8J7ILY4_9BACT|nr:indolepyruvate oxidoreductase subunit beta [Geomesophilobacter sediminis]MBJ6723588.1 indolepyruvate oxidoreductase subunit beta [Geomesophilobacter sediminis]